MGLRENAAAAAGRPIPVADDEGGVSAAASEPLPDLSDYVPREGENWDMVPVHVAWLRVRRDIAWIGKGDAHVEEKNGMKFTKYMFRGYERTVAAFGPITLKHGVSVIPHRIVSEHRDARSGKGTPMRESTTKVTWRIYGPKGDFMEMESEGEALDYGDKGTAKAQTIAQRVVLLVGGLIPTGTPDSDESNIERGEAPVRPAASYVEEIADPRTSAGRLRQIHHELGTTRQLGAIVTNEVGDEEQIGAMVVRLGKERAAGGGTQ